jgi:hypothetical protein
VSLAVGVQKRLNALVDLDSSQPTLDPIQKHSVDNIKQEIVDMDCTNQDKELVHESNCVNEDVSSRDENCLNCFHLNKVVRNCILTYQ